MVEEEEDCSNLLRLDLSVKNILACHTVQPNRQVKASGGGGGCAVGGGGVSGGGGGGGGRRIQPPYSRVTIPCGLSPSHRFSLNGGRCLAGGCSSSFWNTSYCIWNGQVENDALRRFNRTAMLTPNPFEIRFRRSSTIRPKQFVYQFLNLCSVLLVLFLMEAMVMI